MLDTIGPMLKRVRPHLLAPLLLWLGLCFMAFQGQAWATPLGDQTLSAAPQQHTAEPTQADASVSAQADSAHESVALLSARPMANPASLRTRCPGTHQLLASGGPCLDGLLRPPRQAARLG
jgi:hypothetical protein